MSGVGRGGLEGGGLGRGLYSGGSRGGLGGRNPVGIPFSSFFSIQLQLNRPPNPPAF